MRSVDSAPGEAHGWNHAEDETTATLLVIDPRDEGLHEPGPEPLWSESYYFDAVSDDGQVGVYARLARLPNQGMCLYTAAIVRLGRPAVLVVDAGAPLPDLDNRAQQVGARRFGASQHCTAPLEEFVVWLAGVGEEFDEPSAPLAGGRGRDVEVALDLKWATDGVPYRWRVLDRYEIPCRVSGTVRVGNETIPFSGAGQRDHSYGVRDWWSDEWMWSAFRLDDGTRIHAVTLPAAPGVAVGYVQKKGSVAEIAWGQSDFTDGPDGLPLSAWIDIEPGGRLQVKPVAFGALRMESPNGRVSHFPRAMARVRMADGRSGTGWIEWNRIPRLSQSI
jgi:hypothetical protein